jgi:fused signal recognition particle receptor
MVISPPATPPGRRPWELLQIWGERQRRGDPPLEGADPASGVYDAIAAAKAGTRTDYLDTAGRLHNRKNLMDDWPRSEG